MVWTHKTTQLRVVLSLILPHSSTALLNHYSAWSSDINVVDVVVIQ